MGNPIGMERTSFGTKTFLKDKLCTVTSLISENYLEMVYIMCILHKQEGGGVFQGICAEILSFFFCAGLLSNITDWGCIAFF